MLQIKILDSQNLEHSWFYCIQTAYEVICLQNSHLFDDFPLLRKDIICWIQLSFSQVLSSILCFSPCCKSFSPIISWSSIIPIHWIFWDCTVQFWEIKLSTLKRFFSKFSDSPNKSIYSIRRLIDSRNPFTHLVFKLWECTEMVNLALLIQSTYRFCPDSFPPRSMDPP